MKPILKVEKTLIVIQSSQSESVVSDEDDLNHFIPMCYFLSDAAGSLVVTCNCG